MIPTPGMFLEAVVDGGAGGDGGAAVAEAAPEGAAAEPVAVEPVAAPAGFDYDDPRLQDQIDARASQIAQQQIDQLMQRAQAQAQQQTQQQQPGIDPASFVDEYGNVNPAALVAIQQGNQHVLAAVQQMQAQLQAQQSQFQAQQEAETVAQGEARLEDILADDIARNGDFVRAAGNTPEQTAAAKQADQAARQLVRTTADQLFPEIAQRYGATPRAAEIAMERASDQVRTLLRAAGQSATAAQANQLATLAGQNGEVGGAGAGAGAVSRPVVKFGERVVDRYAGPALTQ